MDNLKSKLVLGRGLSALIPSSSETSAQFSYTGQTSSDSTEAGKIASIEIAKIRPNPYQPRLDFLPQALDELKRSIKEKGILQPVTVRRTGGGAFELISGERRVRASQELGLQTIPAYIISVTSDAEMLELGLIENLQRDDLNPIEIAISFKRLMEECIIKAEDVAQKVGKDRSTVVNFLRLLRLPDKIQQSVRDNKISMGHARALLSASDEKTQIRLHKKILDEGWSVRKIEQAIKGPNGKTPSTQSSRTAPALKGGAEFQSIESRLRQQFGTKVTVRKNSNGGGEVVIEYYSADDLDRVIEMLER
ncbi:MAG TPA: ParB/RepB/Spo0J family partition protein [Bacteroidota bacterium]|nr:ParB/RepB/Spo0J family partition protein [Bacteroidota bacterium]